MSNFLRLVPLLCLIMTNLWLTILAANDCFALTIFKDFLYQKKVAPFYICTKFRYTKRFVSELRLLFKIISVLLSKLATLLFKEIHGTTLGIKLSSKKRILLRADACVGFLCPPNLISPLSLLIKRSKKGKQLIILGFFYHQ